MYYSLSLGKLSSASLISCCFHHQRRLGNIRNATTFLLRQQSGLRFGGRVDNLQHFVRSLLYPCWPLLRSSATNIVNKTKPAILLLLKCPSRSRRLVTTTTAAEEPTTRHGDPTVDTAMSSAAKEPLVGGGEEAPTTLDAHQQHRKRKPGVDDPAVEIDSNPRRPDQSNNTSSHGKKKKKEKVNRSWAPDGGKDMHLGSYAMEAQRLLFGVSLPDRPDDPSSTTEPSTAESLATITTATSKKKVALLIGYVGTQYGGFQINQGIRSVQAELELALLKCGFLSHSNFGFPSKISWSTSGRTDKGVHAAAQTVSFKMELTPAQQQLDDDETKRISILESLNAHLPADIRVLDIGRTTRNFCAKTQRDRVRYQYLIPTFVFSPNLEQILRDSVQYPSNGQPSHLPVSPEEVSRIQQTLAEYRVTPTQLTTLKEVLNSYVGTHSFHNFTRRCQAHEMRANRYIMDFDVSDPIVVPLNDSDKVGVEWIPTTVTGQSFLFNQIRKMIGLAVDVTSGATDMDTVRRALDKKPPSNDPIRIAIAPPQGLYLDMSFYTSYNRRKNENKTEDTPMDLEWFHPDTPANARWKAFRDDVIVKHVVAEEAAQGNFIQYLYTQTHMPDFNRNDDDPQQNDDNDQDDEGDAASM